MLMAFGVPCNDSQANDVVLVVAVEGVPYLSGMVWADLMTNCVFIP